MILGKDYWTKYPNLEDAICAQAYKTSNEIAEQQRQIQANKTKEEAEVESKALQLVADWAPIIVRKRLENEADRSYVYRGDTVKTCDGRFSRRHWFWGKTYVPPLYLVKAKEIFSDLGFKAKIEFYRSMFENPVFWLHVDITTKAIKKLQTIPRQ